MMVRVNNASPEATGTLVSTVLDKVRANPFWEVASIELFGSTLPQIALFVQSRTESLDKFFTNGLEWVGQFPVAYAWNRLLTKQVFEPMMKPDALTPELKRTYDFGLTMASVLPISGYIFFLPSLRNALRAKVLHQNSYVGAIGLDKLTGSPTHPLDKEDEASTAKQSWRTFALGQGSALAAGLAFIPLTQQLLKHRWALPEVDWHLKANLPALNALGKPYQAIKNFVETGMHVKPLDLFTVKDGNMLNMTLGQEAWSGAAPAYGGYLRFSQDKVEVGDIIPRIVTYALSVPFGPSRFFNNPQAQAAFEGKRYPIIGDGKNLQLLARVGLSCLVYTGLPQLYTLATRKKRAEHAGLIQASPAANPSTEAPLQSPPRLDALSLPIHARHAVSLVEEPKAMPPLERRKATVKAGLPYLTDPLFSTTL